MHMLRTVAVAACALLCAAAVGSAQEDYVVIRAFADTGPEGGNPMAGLVKASDGNFYGSTAAGVFRVAPNGAAALINHSPVFFGLIQASDGFLYGSTGVEIYKVGLTGETTLVTSFADNCLDGLIAGPLVEGDDGNFYGIARTACSGLVPSRIFRMTPSGIVSTVHTFPFTEVEFHQGLVKSRDGNFYGTTPYGALGHGSIFRLAPSGEFTTLHTFIGGLGGSRPAASLLEGQDGYFYGTTVEGGIGYGTVFRFRPGSDFTVLHVFLSESLDGINPRTALIEGGDGYLYGSTPHTIFRLTPGGKFRTVTRGISVIAWRYGAEFSSLVEGNDGNFYGTAESAGPAGDGVAFRLNRERSPCVNDVNLEHARPPSEEVLFTQVFKTESTSLAGAWFVTQSSVETLWFGRVPPITPTIMTERVLPPFAPMGSVGVFSFVLTSDFHVCADWTSFDTGGPGPTAEELKEAALSAVKRDLGPLMIWLADWP